MDETNSYGRSPKTGEPACPHTVERLTSAKQFPPTIGTECPSCKETWLSQDADTRTKIEPSLFPCGLHALCLSCLHWRRASLAYCTVRCRLEPLPLQPEYCRDCREWQTLNPDSIPAHLAHPLSKRILELRQDMADDLDFELTDLIGDDSYFHVSKAVRSRLVQYWRAQLRDYDGQHHYWQDLAALLDPLRGADIDPVETWASFRVLLRPFPDAETHGYLGPDPSIAARFPDGEEPWITTFLRTQCCAFDRAESQVVEGRTFMAGRQKHIRNPSDLLDWHDNAEIEWPICRILEHRFAAGFIEYKIRYLSSTPAEDVWVWPVQISRHTVFRVYNRENGVAFDEAWLDWDSYRDPGTWVESSSEDDSPDEHNDAEVDADSTGDGEDRSVDPAEEGADTHTYVYRTEYESANKGYDETYDDDSDTSASTSASDASHSDEDSEDESEDDDTDGGDTNDGDTDDGDSDTSAASDASYIDEDSDVEMTDSD